MFKSFGNIANIMKQAQEMKSRMGEMESKLAEIRTTGTAGGGLVVVDANGQQKILTVRIDEKLLNSDDREMLEDLIAAATNEALQLAKEAAAEQMAELTGGMNLPGMEEMIQQLSPTDTNPSP